MSDNSTFRDWEGYVCPDGSTQSADSVWKGPPNNDIMRLPSDTTSFIGPMTFYGAWVEMTKSMITEELITLASVKEGGNMRLIEKSRDTLKELRDDETKQTKVLHKILQSEN
jgi:hypothetical protein